MNFRPLGPRAAALVRRSRGVGGQMRLLIEVRERTKDARPGKPQRTPKAASSWERKPGIASSRRSRSIVATKGLLGKAKRPKPHSPNLQACGRPFCPRARRGAARRRRLRPRARVLPAGGHRRPVPSPFPQWRLVFLCLLLRSPCRVLRLYEGALACRGCLKARGFRHRVELIATHERVASPDRPPDLPPRRRALTPGLAGRSDWRPRLEPKLRRSGIVARQHALDEHYERLEQGARNHDRPGRRRPSRSRRGRQGPRPLRLQRERRGSGSRRLAIRSAPPSLGGTRRSKWSRRCWIGPSLISRKRFTPTTAGGAPRPSFFVEKQCPRQVARLDHDPERVGRFQDQLQLAAARIIYRWRTDDNDRKAADRAEAERLRTEGAVRRLGRTPGGRKHPRMDVRAVFTRRRRQRLRTTVRRAPHRWRTCR